MIIYKSFIKICSQLSLYADLEQAFSINLETNRSFIEIWSQLFLYDDFEQLSVIDLIICRSFIKIYNQPIYTQNFFNKL